MDNQNQPPNDSEKFELPNSAPVEPPPAQAPPQQPQTTQQPFAHSADLKKADPPKKIFSTKIDTNLYPGQPTDEITQRVIYKHIISILPFIFAILVVSTLTIGGLYYVGANPQIIPSTFPTGLISLAAVVLMALLVFLFFGVIWIWRRNKIVITDQHIVDIDQVGIFNRSVATLRLEEIQDISAEVRGPMQTIFQYGSIIIQTAGERANFLFDYVPDPYELEHYVLEIRKKYYDTDNDDRANAIAVNPQNRR